MAILIHVSVVSGKGSGQIAQSAVDAENAFAAIVMNITGCDEQTAHQVTALYLKNKLAKRDLWYGRITVTHGAYLEQGVLNRAIQMVCGGAA
jgi:hypothetical protein